MATGRGASGAGDLERAIRNLSRATSQDREELLCAFVRITRDEIGPRRDYLARASTAAAEKNVQDTVGVVVQLLGAMPYVRQHVPMRDRRARELARRIENILISADEDLRIFRDSLQLIRQVEAGKSAASGGTVSQLFSLKAKLNKQFTEAIKDLRTLAVALDSFAERVGCLGTASGQGRGGSSTGQRDSDAPRSGLVA